MLQEHGVCSAANALCQSLNFCNDLRQDYSSQIDQTVLNSECNKPIN